MAQLEVVNLEGKKVGTVEVADGIFGEGVHHHALWESVKAYLASLRAGTHSTLRRDEVRGGGRKPYKQKGTGNARQGSTRAPQFVGGGKVFGPKPRDYSYSVPKKVHALALRGILGERIGAKKLVVVNNLLFSSIKTKQIAEVWKKLSVHSVLLVDQVDNTNLQKSVRNLPQTKFVSVGHLNTYDVLKYDTVVLTTDTLKQLEQRLGA